MHLIDFGPNPVLAIACDLALGKSRNLLNQSHIARAGRGRPLNDGVTGVPLSALRLYGDRIPNSKRSSLKQHEGMQKGN